MILEKRTIIGVAGLGVLLNEIRGLVLAVPVLATLWASGGTLMAIWLAFCSLAGIALSVIVPLFILRKVEKRCLPSSD